MNLRRNREGTQRNLWVDVKMDCCVGAPVWDNIKIFDRVKKHSRVWERRGKRLDGGVGKGHGTGYLKDAGRGKTELP